MLGKGWYSRLDMILFEPGMRLLENVREDDIFLLLDADELPNKESLLFLKLFDGLVFEHILTKSSY